MGSEFGSRKFVGSSCRLPAKMKWKRNPDRPNKIGEIKIQTELRPTSAFDNPTQRLRFAASRLCDVAQLLLRVQRRGRDKVLNKTHNYRLTTLELA
jgi:hypothetical protein